MTQLHAYPGGIDLRRMLTAARPNDTLHLHAGEYTSRIDTYDGPIQGGSSWSSKLVIRAYKPPGKPVERVVLRPEGGDYVIRCAHPSASYIEFRGLVLDAATVERHAVKVTYSGTDPANTAHHVRFVECELLNARHSGAHWTAPNVEFIRCIVHHNGTVQNLDHGLYGSGPNALVEDCDLYENAACGVHIYNGTERVAHRPRIIRNRCWLNGTAGPTGEDILIASGDGGLVDGNTCWGSDHGILIYGSTRNARVLRNVLGASRRQRLYIAPEAQATTVLGTGVDGNVEI